MTTSNNNKVTINGIERDTRDMSPEQLQLLDAVSLADQDLYKANTRLAVTQAGRDALVKQLIDSFETVADVATDRDG